MTDLRQTLGRDVGASDALVDVAIWRGIVFEMRRGRGRRMRLRVRVGGLLGVLMWMMDRSWRGRVLMVLW